MLREERTALRELPEERGDRTVEREGYRVVREAEPPVRARIEDCRDREVVLREVEEPGAVVARREDAEERDGYLETVLVFRDVEGEVLSDRDRLGLRDTEEREERMVVREALEEREPEPKVDAREDRTLMRRDSAALREAEARGDKAVRLFPVRREGSDVREL